MYIDLYFKDTLILNVVILALLDPGWLSLPIYRVQLNEVFPVNFSIEL